MTTAAAFPAAAMNRARQRLAGTLNNRPLADEQKSLFDERTGHDQPCPIEDPGKGRSRDAHSFGGRLLIQTLVVSEAEGFEFVGPQGLDFEVGGWPAHRFEAPPLRHATDCPGLFRSSHEPPSYEHMLITGVRQALG